MQAASKSALKRIVTPIIDAIPGARKIVHRLRHGKKPAPAFVGWGMSTNRVPPWQSDTKIAKDFLKANDELLAAVREGRFAMTQYKDFKDKESILKGLMWRHFLIFWSVRYAHAAPGASIAECGVSDGLTAFFAIKALDGSKKAYLYDAWDKMTEDFLLPSESRHLNDYEYLSIGQTKKNLEGLPATYVKGYIPEVFKAHKTPTDVIWLHIDLNASKPTADALKEFYDNMPTGGIIIFDDYAGRAFADTRKVVDAFFADKNGILLPMPTGQSVFFKQ